MGTGVSLRPNQLASLRGEEGWGWIRGGRLCGWARRSRMGSNLLWRRL